MSHYMLVACTVQFGAHYLEKGRQGGRGVLFGRVFPAVALRRTVVISRRRRSRYRSRQNGRWPGR